MTALVIIETVTIGVLIAVFANFMHKTDLKLKKTAFSDKEQDQIRQVLEVLFYKGDGNEDKN